MYRLATTNAWYNNMVMPSLSAAIAKAKALRETYKGVQFDVMRDIDAHSTRLVWTCDGLPCQTQWCRLS